MVVTKLNLNNDYFKINTQKSVNDRFERKKKPYFGTFHLMSKFFVITNNDFKRFIKDLSKIYNKKIIPIEDNKKNFEVGLRKTIYTCIYILSVDKPTKIEIDKVYEFETNDLFIFNELQNNVYFQSMVKEKDLFYFNFYIKDIELEIDNFIKSNKRALQIDKQNFNSKKYPCLSLLECEFIKYDTLNVEDSWTWPNDGHCSCNEYSSSDSDEDESSDSDGDEDEDESSDSDEDEDEDESSDSDGEIIYLKEEDRMSRFDLSDYLHYWNEEDIKEKKNYNFNLSSYRGNKSIKHNLKCENVKIDAFIPIIKLNKEFIIYSTYDDLSNIKSENNLKKIIYPMRKNPVIDKIYDNFKTYKILKEENYKHMGDWCIVSDYICKEHELNLNNNIAVRLRNFIFDNYKIFYHSEPIAFEEEKEHEFDYDDYKIVYKRVYCCSYLVKNKYLFKEPSAKIIQKNLRQYIEKKYRPENYLNSNEGKSKIKNFNSKK